MRIQTIVTINSAVPVNVAVLFRYKSAADQQGQPMVINRIFCQMLPAGTGVGYVMDGIPFGTTPNPATAGQLTAVLAAASATDPGGSYSDRGAPNEGFIYGENFWVGGSQTGDKMVVSCDVRV